MEQYTNLSPAVRNIVDNYFFDDKDIFFGPKKKLELMASLYSMMDGAKAEVIDIFHDSVKDLRDILSVEDIELLRREYSSVMQYCFEKSDPVNESLYYVDENGYTNKMLPKSLLKLCLEFESLDEGSEVYLPYAGFTQMPLLMPKANYDGFEKNEERWALSQMILHACGIHSSIKLTDDMNKALPEGKLYDYIFCMPPFVKGNELRSVINNIYELATKHLAKNGSLCCILPEIFCYATSGWSDLRKILIDYKNNYSAIVITLPQLPNLFSATKLCIFNLVNDGNGNILLMDASRNDAFKVVHDPNYYEDWYINTDSIIATLNHGSSDFVVLVEKSELYNNAVDLTPSRYLVKNIIPEPSTRNGESLRRIGELIEVVPTESIGVEEIKIPILGMKELSDNYLNCDIPYTAVPLKNSQPARFLKENCLLVGFIGGKFKVGRTIDLSEKQKVALRYEIIPFRLKNNIVSEDFLLRNFMFNDNVKEQARMLSTGVTISRLSIRDLLKIEIIVPNFEVQDLLSKEDVKQSLLKADIKQKEADDEFRRDMHLKTHAIGQTIFNLKNWWKTLQRARKEGNGIVDDNAIVGRTQKAVVKDIYDSIQQTIDHLQQQINKFDRGNGLVTENICLTKFIEDYINTHKSPIFRFDYDADSHHHLMDFDGEEVYDERGNIVGINNLKKGEVSFEHAVFAPEALTIIFDNIVHNACSHGFVEKEDNSNDNVIKIELYTEGTDHIITISNNGTPAHEDVNEDYVFRFSKSTQLGRGHSGIGGYEVKHLMREFEGDAEFISQPNDAFPVTYKLIFHNTGIVSIDLDF